MLIARTLFDDNGRPLGKAVQDGMTGAVRFIPRGLDEPLPTIWLSIEACRQSVLRQVSEASGVLLGDHPPRAAQPPSFDSNRPFKG